MWMAAASFAIALIAAPPAHAFGFSGVGGKLGYSNPENLDGTAEMGVHAELERPGTRVHLLPNVMYWNVDRVRDLSPNMDVYYHFNPEGKMSPYLGGGVGLNFVHRARTDAGSTDLGMNVLGGLKFPGSANHYFLEGRFTASDINQVSLLTGITFHSPR
jgi:hypothetical protein